MSFTGGRLKLKGSGPSGVSKKKKKKSAAGGELALVDSKAEDDSGNNSGLDGKVRACRAFAELCVCYWLPSVADCGVDDVFLAFADLDLPIVCRNCGRATSRLSRTMRQIGGRRQSANSTRSRPSGRQTGWPSWRPSRTATA